MAILNLPTFIEQAEKTPEQKMLESLQQMQIERPQAEVPRFTRYGNRMAERGGFDVLPQEQLRGMTQQQVDEYEAERRKARGAGISETLMRVGQAFAGRDASGLALQREQARQAQQQQAEQEAQTQRMLASMTPEQRQIYNMKKMGLPDSYIQSQFYPKQEKKGTQRYTVYDRETGTPIRSISAYDQEAINAAENNPKELIGSFAGLSKDKPSKLTKSDFVVDILTKIRSHVPTDEDPTYKLTPQDLQVLDTVSNTDPMKQLIRNLTMGYVDTQPQDINTQPAVSITTKEEFDKLPKGAKYIFNGQEFIKGQ